MFSVLNESVAKSSTLQTIETLLLQAGYTMRPSTRCAGYDVVALLDGETQWTACAFDDLAETDAPVFS